MTTDVELLQYAKEVLLKGEWGQGSFGSAKTDDGLHCIVGALHRSEYLFGFQHSLEKHRALYGYIAEAIGSETVTCWNDVRGRTLTEVIDAYDRAIALAKEAEA